MKVWVVCGTYGGILNGLRGFTSEQSARKYARLLQIHADEEDDQISLFMIDLDQDPANGQQIDFGKMPTIREFFAGSERRE
jgi:hypothetical protein